MFNCDISLTSKQLSRKYYVSIGGIDSDEQLLVASGQ